jgi:hypothetical protein
MCLVIDACCIAKVFDRGNRQHLNYAPVLEWVSNGNGCMIYGGTKYGIQLRGLPRYLGIIAELQRRGRAIVLPQAHVDAIADTLRAGITDPDFNDEHLIAIVIVSRCRVVCTEDKVAIVYLKRRQFYSCHGMKRPKIYQSSRNRNLCCDENVVDIHGH